MTSFSGWRGGGDKSEQKCPSWTCQYGLLVSARSVKEEEISEFPLLVLLELAWQLGFPGLI